MSTGYIPVKPRTIDDVVKEKMIVLEELCVVDDNNRKEVQAMLFSEIRKCPGMDADRIADRVGRTLFSRKFG